MIPLLWKMISKNYVISSFQNENAYNTWLEKVESSSTLAKIEFLFFFFDKSIRWDKSFKDMSECAKCRSTNNESDDVRLWVKAKCKECDVIYHLNCLEIVLQTNENNEIPCETNLFFSNPKNERLRKAICFACNKMNKEKEIETENLNREKRRIESLNSIEKGNHALRLNKSRINK